MSLESFIENYGYLALVVGTFFEGETILVLGGFLAHRGYLELPWVILAAFAGSLSGDQLLFFLGRKHSPYIFRKLPSLHARIELVNAKLRRYHTLLILGFRFVYGFRTVTPFALGMSPVSTMKFVILNTISAMLWASAIGTAGYLFGKALETLLGDIRRYELKAMLGIWIVGLAIWTVHVLRKRKKKKLMGTGNNSSK